MTMPASPERTDAKRTAAKQRSSRCKQHGVQGGTSEANRLAVVILEVLAGERTPADAAVALGITPPRYYQLEARALQGLVAALEPRPQGKQPSVEGRIAKLEKALEEARRQCARQEALVRVAQRSLGIQAPASGQGKPTGKDRAGRKKRRPTVRALKAARALANRSGRPQGELLQPGHPEDRLVADRTDGNGASPEGARGTSAGAEG
jgi:hypothetical protein